MMGDINTCRKQRYVLQVHVGSYSRLYEALSIEAEKTTTAHEIVDCICEKLCLSDGTDFYELAEVIGNQGGQDCKERRIGPNECPIQLKLLWPKKSENGHIDYKFCLRRKWMGNLWSLSMTDSNDSQLIRDYFLRFLYQPRNSEYPDLCQLPDLTEQTLLDNLKARFEKNHIYTYVGSILIAVNPFTFYPIYNPKYVQLYQNRRLGDLPPHIFAIADAAYQSMLRKRTNQCIVISGESGSGKTESTNLLLHHLTALTQKGTHGSGVEQTILGAGPVLEAFGNAKTKFNNNSSRFGKFIQVNYKENGAVHGALVQKYLLEKSRIVSQVKNERNYHVFYYLLDGLATEIKQELHLTRPQDYFYLNQSKCYTLDLEVADECHEFFRLTQSMELVGFSKHKQYLCFCVLSAVLHLGNVQFSKKSTYHSDETVMVANPEVVTIISKLLNVKEETLTAALTCKKTKAAKGEMLVINYKLPDAIATRDAMAKCLYGALFDWIVMQVNHALLSKKDTRDHKGNSIGVLDIFGFEDFNDHNNFEQFCINYANERLQYYFNQHVFKYEQEEYQREGISWRNIDFNDNTECLRLIEDKPDGLLYLLDDQCNFPCGSNETILQKFIYHHNSNSLFEVPPCRGSAFIIKHYAGKVKYQIRDFREKNLDLMRPDIVAVLKVSQMAFVRELVCSDPLALFRWQILKAFFRAYFIFTKLRESFQKKRDTFYNGTTESSKFKTPKRNTHLKNSVSLRKKKYSSTSYCHFQRKNGFEKSIRNFKLLKQLLGPPIALNSPASVSSKDRPVSVPRAARKQTQTVTHQFQQSLQQLMDTLSHANPFFVRCIKSNAEKMPNHFDDRLVLQQLRYTGMLETVRIRQSGYSVRLTFDEFIQHYRILLPKGLLSSKMDVQKFLLKMNLPQDMYQIGKTKVFLRESEKLALDERLHEEILRRIVNLQRWVRTWICRRRFNEMRNAAVVIQTYFRRFIAQKRLKQLKIIAQYENWAANAIQKHWRAYQTRKWFVDFRKSIVKFQSNCRGYLVRLRTSEMQKECAIKRAEAAKLNDKTSTNLNASNVSVRIRATPPNSVFIRESDITIGMVSPAHEAAHYHQHPNGITIHSVGPGQNFIVTPTQESQSSSIHLDIPVQITIHNANDEIVNQQIDCLRSQDENETELVECDDLADEDEFHNNDQVRLNRKRNIPIRKTSFKRKANKFLSDEKSSSSTLNLESSSDLLNNDINENLSNHRQLTKLSSDSHTLCLSTSSFISSGYSTNSDSTSSIQKLRVCESPPNSDLQNLSVQSILIGQSSTSGPGIVDVNESSANESKNQSFLPKESLNANQNWDEQITVGAIQKAKATFRNIMGKSNLDLNKRVLKQTTSVKTGNEIENTNHQYNLLSIKSLSNNDLGYESTNIYLSNDMSKNPTVRLDSLDDLLDDYPIPRSKSRSQDGNFTLLSRHSFMEDSNSKLGEICAICENAILIKAQQPPPVHLKCTECKQLFHKKCIHLSSDIPCLKEGSFKNPSVLEALNPSRPPRTKQKKAKTSDINSDAKENQECQSESMTTSNDSFMKNKQSVRVKEFTDPHDVLITDLDELQLMDKFISKKMREMDDVRGKKTKESMVDVVFKRALKEFKANLISTYSVGNQDGYFRLTYKDLIVHFEQILLNVCQVEKTYKSFPVIIGVNAFRGYMGELRNIHNNKMKDDKLYGSHLKKTNKKKQNKKRPKNKKEDDVYKTFEHEFYFSTVNIYTVCEVCDSYMWLMDKILICRHCKLTCHKKCFQKVTSKCGENSKSSNRLIFGAPLASLVSEQLRIPLVVDQLITKIELKGLYTEGIYRKSARLTSIDEVRQKFDSRQGDVDLDLYTVHVLAGCLKLFFREMPEPLMTYELYDDFLWATTVTDQTERIQIIFNHISKLPKPNYDLLERLTFHLARVAQQESANRMNANSLAIVFAPCILRTKKFLQMQDKLNDINKQTICIESIISERMRQISDTLNDIDILDTACHTASSRLSSIRHSKMNLNRDSIIRTHSNADDEEALLAQHITELITEKNHLTNILPTFRIASACSDEDILSSNENEEIANANASSEEFLPSSTNKDDIKSIQFTQEKIEPTKNWTTIKHSSSTSNVLNHNFKQRINIKSFSFDDPKEGSPSLSLDHLTKNRVSLPHRRKPTSKQKSAINKSNDDLVDFVDLEDNIKSSKFNENDSQSSSTSSSQIDLVRISEIPRFEIRTAMPKN